MFKQKSDSPAPVGKAEPADAVQQARTRARHRLIGAIVLLAIGIIGFPLVFETQPRPVPIDIPIEIPRRDNAPPLVMPAAPPSAVASGTTTIGQAAPEPSAPAPTVTAAPAPKPASRPGSEIVTESAADAGRDVTPAREARAAAAASAASRVDPARRVAAASSPPREPDTAPRPDSSDGERARALLEGRPVAAAEGGRFVVQVGAFADADAARETRRQVDKLGLRTYTQVAQTASGSRIRVRAGPFATRAEADAAQAKAKAAGLAAAVVLTL